MPGLLLLLDTKYDLILFVYFTWAKPRNVVGGEQGYTFRFQNLAGFAFYIESK